MKLTDDAKPIVEPVRNVPYALRDKMKAHLDDMVVFGELEKVEEPTDWVLPHVIVRKTTNKIKVAIDTRKLNQYVKREFYRPPTFDDIAVKLNGAKIFTVLDASHAFAQIPVDKETSEKLILGTPFGRYRYLTLPYGLASSPEVFQKAMDNLLSTCQNVAVYADDIIVFGKTETEHDKALVKLLETARKNNLTLARDKIQFKKSRLKYLGHIISEKGLEPNPEKVAAVAQFPVPQNREQVKSFLGFITYLGKFIPDLATKTKPLRDLTSVKNVFVWNKPQQDCFDELKRLASAAPVLSYFDPDAPIVLSVDASQFGIGAVLLQNGQPVAYASLSLSKTQQRYSQIEKEALAVVAGIKKFHQYVYATKFVVETDHKPLLTIFKKELDSLSPRLLRLVLKALPYSFTLVHRPGKELLVADALSRAPQSDRTIDTSFLEEEVGVINVHGVVLSASHQSRLQTAIAQDPVLSKLRQYIIDGFPKIRKSLPVEIRFVWAYRESLRVEENLVLRDNRLFVPTSLRHEYIAAVHKSHQGINTCLRRARQSFYWPNMSDDITKFIESCDICGSYASANKPSKFVESLIPELPWEEVATDLFDYQGSKYLLVVDYFSKFIEVKKLGTNSTSSPIINALTQIFATHGIPQRLRSDNGPPFNSSEFAEFANNYAFRHITSSPHHPKSNGLVERSIQTIKGLFKKSKSEYEAILNYNSAEKEELPAPSMLLMGRRIRTTLPVHTSQLQPLFRTAKYRKLLIEIQRRMVKSSDRHQPARFYKIGQTVWVKTDHRKWTTGVIRSICPEPHSYVIQVGEKHYRRNAAHIRPRIVTSSTADNNKFDSPQKPLVSDRPKRDVKKPLTFAEEYGYTLNMQ